MRQIDPALCFCPVSLSFGNIGCSAIKDEKVTVEQIGYGWVMSFLHDQEAFGLIVSGEKRVQQDEKKQDQSPRLMQHFVLWYVSTMVLNMTVFALRMEYRILNVVLFLILWIFYGDDVFLLSLFCFVLIQVITHKYIFFNDKNVIDMIDVVVIINGCIKTKQQQQQGLCKDYFLFVYILASWIRLFKLYFMVVNEIIVIVFFDILSMYIDKSVSILSKYIFLNDWLFYFDFIRYGSGTPTTNTLIIAIIIARNNSSVLVTSFIIGVFYPAGLKDEFVKFFKMVGLALEYSIFILLLFLEVMFILVIDFLNQYILQQQLNQLLLVRYFYLSCKAEVNFNCIRIFRLYLEYLQIFECVRMIVNGIILLTYDILFKHIFFNDLFFYFLVFIFILGDIAPTERQERKINRIAGVPISDISGISAATLNSSSTTGDAYLSMDDWTSAWSDGMVDNFGELQYYVESISITSHPSPTTTEDAFDDFIFGLMASLYLLLAFASVPVGAVYQVVLSFLFKNASGAQRWTAISYIILGIVLLMVSWILDLTGVKVNDDLKTIYQIFPTYGIVLPDVLYPDTSYYSDDVIGEEQLTKMLGEGFGYFALLLLIEWMSHRQQIMQFLGLIPNTIYATAVSINGAPHKNCLNHGQGITLLYLCAISNQRDITNENDYIGIDNFELLFRVDAVFVNKMVMSGRDTNNNESKHPHATFSNELEKEYLSLNEIKLSFGRCSPLIYCDVFTEFMIETCWCWCWC